MALSGTYFDADYYFTQYSDVAANWSGTAMAHYEAFGANEERMPNSWFDSQYYRANNIDLQSMTASELFEHYEAFGYAEGRVPSSDYAYFDEAQYLSDYSDLGANGITEATALSHYLQYGIGESRVAKNDNDTTVVPSDPTTADTFTLTEGADTATANIFNAGRVTLVDDDSNSLQDDDVLVGVGVAPTLNFNYVDDDTRSADYDISPTLDGVEVINIKHTTSFAAQLDLQDARGVNEINISRMDNTLTVDNIDQEASTLTVKNSNEIDNSLGFLFQTTALVETDDTVALGLESTNLTNLVIQDVVGSTGYETINLDNSNKASNIGTITAQDLQTLTVTGNANLTLGDSDSVTNAGLVEATHYTAGFANVAGSMNTLDASAFTGVLDVTMGGEMNAFQDGTSGVLVDFALTGGTGNDVFRFANGINVDSGDTLSLIHI